MPLNEMIFHRKSIEQIADKADLRLEPSAVNSQPWYFTHKGDTIHVHCGKKGSRLDAGIGTTPVDRIEALVPSA